MIKTTAIVICSEVVGGHEHQAKTLIHDLQGDCHVDVFVSNLECQKFFEDNFCNDWLKVQMLGGFIFERGIFLKQIYYGIRDTSKILHFFAKYDRVMIVAGTIEASIKFGVAFRRSPRVSLYLPSIYDRRLVWGGLGCIYNAIVFPLLNLYSSLLTINGVQKYLMRKWYSGDINVRRNKCDVYIGEIQKDFDSRLVVIGRLDENKRVLELLLALENLKSPCRDILIFGDGPLYDAAVSMTRHFVWMRVVFCGYKNKIDIFKSLGKHDILLLNSRYEGEPLVVREAKLAKIRVLVRDIPGVRGISKRSERFRDYRDLIEKINELTF